MATRMTRDNRITNRLVKQGKLPAYQAEIYDNPNPNQMYGKKANKSEYKIDNHTHSERVYREGSSTNWAGSVAWFNKDRANKKPNVY